MIVTLLRVRLPVITWKIRSLNPLIAVMVTGPVGLMMMLEVISRSPVEAEFSLPLSVRVSVYVPEGMTMVSVPLPAAHSPGLGLLA